MTGTPGIHAGTSGDSSPTRSPHVDVLSDLLATVRISGAVLFRAEFREPWGIAIPDARDMARMLPGCVENVIPFHVADEGSFWVHTGDGTRVRVSAGEAVLVPQGSSHRIGGEEVAATKPVGAVLPHPPWDEAPLIRHGGNGALARIVCGFVNCEDLLLDPFLGGLPPLLHARPGTDPRARWMETAIRYTAHEAARPGPGSRSVLSRLVELMFVEVLRDHMRSVGDTRVGWLAASGDPVVVSALALIHRAHADPWTVDSLARRVGVSRTVLAERFARRLGMPPVHYLARWRLQVAASLLRTTSQPLKAIAQGTGYESEAAFGRAFKRHFGMPPAGWRRRARIDHTGRDPG
jgi:AraC family transcriptional regulator, alkane utilization regulator